ncbi:hypothetical protein [Erythrobacter sp. EC-HK427]|uniref:hypothetical protein n=1 Tax=Erythrobacter sp. EC-HK427 TaxID=2038396 RepID=UPI00125FAA89|nr:hypothetical protein [Erythrobacter sp. EC-HK427]
MSQTFTRREFYDLVWSKPMIHLAKEFGVSDVALHKICRKHNIPNPPLGWWAKKAAGKAIKQIPLPEFDSDRPDAIIIRNAPAADWQTQAIELAEKKARSASRPTAAMPKRGSVIVRNTLAALRRGKENEQGLICVRDAGLVPCSVAKQSIGRIAELLPKLEAAAEVQGFKLTHDDEPSRFSDGAQTVKFEITEAYTREKHELTRKEKAEQAAWDKRSERRAWRYVHGDPYPIFADWDYHSTGRLSISLEPVWYYRQPTPRRSFNDGKRQRLEDLVDKIAIGIAVVAAAKTERDEEEEKQAREREKERAAQEAAARSRYIEDRRQAELTSLLLAQQRTNQLEQLLSRMVGEATPDREARISVFESWLQRQIDEKRQLFTREGLETHFEHLKLFGQDDDKNFNG